MLDLTKYDGHTPGPWFIGSYDLIDAQGSTIATFRKDDDFPEQGANCELIADAPKLLAELEQAQKHIANQQQANDKLQRKYNTIKGDLLVKQKRIAELEKENGKATALLRELEWSGMNLNVEKICPSCRLPRKANHAPDCRLAAFLKETGAAIGRAKRAQEKAPFQGP